MRWNGSLNRVTLISLSSTMIKTT